AGPPPRGPPPHRPRRAAPGAGRRRGGRTGCRGRPGCPWRTAPGRPGRRGARPPPWGAPGGPPGGPSPRGRGGRGARGWAGQARGSAWVDLRLIEARPGATAPARRLGATQSPTARYVVGSPLRQEFSPEGRVTVTVARGLFWSAAFQRAFFPLP